MRAKTYLLVLSLLLGVVCSTYAQSNKVERQRQLEPAIKTFEEADQKKPPPKGAVLFIGSSSIALWKNLADDFPAVRIINRGFGGSHIEDSIYFADRIVFRYRPRLIVLYAGDNDIESGKSPAVVLEDFKKFVAVVHQKLPRTRRAFISIKPSPARWHLVNKVREANWLIQEFTRRMVELAPAFVLGSRPVNEAGRRLNQGFVWDQTAGYRAAHLKRYLPNEDGFWEASWYERGHGRFTPISCGSTRIGFQICTDLWFMERARAYGKAGVHLIVNPRATATPTLDKWLAGGRAAAVVAGAYCLSSNRVSERGSTVTFGGQGWIVGPDGEVFALTSPARPFVTVEIDLNDAERAKSTYPRYVS